MADIQIPQYTPGQPQFIDPTAMISELYNRPKPGEIAANSLNQGVSNLYNQYIQNQQNKIKAFEAGGPVLMNSLYGNGQPQTGAPGTAPQVPSSGQMTPGAAPPAAQPAQGAPAGQSQPVPATIQAHMDMFGHPNYAALAGNPNLGVHAQKIMDLQGQMGQNAQMGAYGQKLNQGVNDQLGAEKALMEGENFNAGQQRQQAQFDEGQKNENTRHRQSIDAEESRFKRGKAAEEVSKLGPQQTETNTLNGMFKNLDSNLHGYFSGNHLPGSGNVYRATKGRLGSSSGAEVLNQGKPLVASINQILTHRFNMGESQLLSDSLAPSPNDTPQYAASKMKMLHQIINSMSEGNQQNLSNVLAAARGQQVSLSNGQ